MRTDAGVFDVSHMGEIEVEGPTARELLQAMLSNDVDRLATGEAQYTLLTNDARRDRRRPDRLPHRPVPLPARRERVEPRDRLRLARGARAARLRRARRLRRVRAARRPGPARARAARARAGKAVHVGDGRARRRRGDGQPHRLHRRGGRRARLHGRRRGRALWDAILARGVTPCGLGARDTLRLEVCYPLHGNDIGPRRTRSRPGSAGCARSTRTSPAPSGCARSRSAGPSGSSSRSG